MVILALVKTPFPGISEGHHSMTRRGFREMWSRGGDGGSVLRGLSFKRINIIGLRDVGKKKKKHSIALETLETCREFIMVQFLEDFRAFHKVLCPGKESCGREPTPSSSSHPTTPSEVAQLCPTLCDPMDCSLPGCSIHRIFQARVLEWVAISFSRGSS